MEMKERLRAVRRSLDLTQKQFAEKIGIKQNTVATYELGRIAPSESVIKLICNTFDINEDWLRTGSGEMFNETDESLSAELKNRFHLSDGAAILIEKFINLKEEDREVVVNFLIGAAENLTSLEKRSLPPEEAYEKSLRDAQRKDSTASSTIDDTGKIAN